MATGDLDGDGRDELILDLGADGLWSNSLGAPWEQLSEQSGEGLITGDLDGDGRDELVVDFGADSGLWSLAEDGDWLKIHNLSPGVLAVGDLDGSGDTDLIASFGAGFGTWVYWNHAEWTQINANPAQAIATGNLDAAPKLPVPQETSATQGVFPDMIRITWEAIPGAAAYKVYRFTLGSQQLLMATVTETIYYDTTVPPGLPHKYVITTVNSEGVESDFLFRTWAPGWAGELPASEKKNNGFIKGM